MSTEPNLYVQFYISEALVRELIEGKKSQARNKVQLLSAEGNVSSIFVNNISRAHIYVLDQALDTGEPMSTL